MAGIVDAIEYSAAFALASSILFLTPLWGPRVVFRGQAVVDHAGRNVPNFSMADLMVLVAMLAAANSATTLLRDETPASYLMAIVVGVNTLVVCGWLLELQFMARHGLARSRSRIVFQIFVFPMAVLGPSGVLSSVLMLLGRIDSVSDSVHTFFTFPATKAALAMLVLSLATCLAARAMFAWMLRAQQKNYV